MLAHQLASLHLSSSGTIELTELKQVMLQLGQNPAEEDLIEMMRMADKNGDNEIDFEEFLILMQTRSVERDTEAELMEAFKLFDLDGSGDISRDELKTLMKNLGQELTDEEIDAMIDEVDINLDGEISFDEFRALMVSQVFLSMPSIGLARTIESQFVFLSLFFIIVRITNFLGNTVTSSLSSPLQFSFLRTKLLKREKDRKDMRQQSVS